VEEEVSVLCHTGVTGHMGMVCGHLIIQTPVVIHFMEGPFMGPSSGQAMEGFHGVVAVAESMGAAEGSVVGSGKKSCCMGASDGILLPLCLYFL
jgi:hypothetical protein